MFIEIDNKEAKAILLKVGNYKITAQYFPELRDFKPEY